jgi:F-type H+/Na+-transporting ATPase subunit beta
MEGRDQHQGPGQGAVSAVHGGVVDVIFPQSPPALNNLLQAGVTGNSVLETVMHLDDRRVRCMALTTTAGLARGSPVRDTGKPLMVPVGPQTLGRMFNTFGQPLDGLGELADAESRSVH